MIHVPQESRFLPFFFLQIQCQIIARVPCFIDTCNVRCIRTLILLLLLLGPIITEIELSHLKWVYAKVALRNNLVLWNYMHAIKKTMCLAWMFQDIGQSIIHVETQALVKVKANNCLNNLKYLHVEGSEEILSEYRQW